MCPFRPGPGSFVISGQRLAQHPNCQLDMLPAERESRVDNFQFYTMLLTPWGWPGRLGEQSLSFMYPIHGSMVPVGSGPAMPVGAHFLRYARMH